ncbi:MAG: 50S ribosomal protein L19 [Chloroflexota bacterium]|nr:50S ribosomal protein L19 [Chloroflexota bacterium]
MIEDNKEKESNIEGTEEGKPEAEAKEEPEAEAKEEPEAEDKEESVAEAKEEPEAEDKEEPEAEAKEEPEVIVEKVLNFDEFRPGDNITVNIKIIEGDRQRTQSFQGDVIKGRFIKSKNPDKTSTFLIRRIASGVGVERIFPFFSPSIESIKLNRKGKVRQARIYYMRERAGKRARIKERRN